MSKLSRVTQRIFGSSAISGEIGVFGSLAAAAPATTSDPAVVQSLANWLEGWFGAVLGGNSPAIEDMNGFCFVMAYQLAYLFQSGIPEWDAATSYYTGSMVNAAGIIYISLVDNNLNHAVTDASKWTTQTAATSVYDAVIGSSAQVTAGRATHSTWASAISAVGAGGSILVLPGSWTENVSLGKQLKIEGSGYGSYLNGTMTFASSSDNSTVKGARFAGAVTVNSGVSFITFTEAHLDSSSSLVDNGTGDYLQAIQH